MVERVTLYEPNFQGARHAYSRQLVLQSQQTLVALPERDSFQCPTANATDSTETAEFLVRTVWVDENWLLIRIREGFWPNNSYLQDVWLQDLPQDGFFYRVAQVARLDTGAMLEPSLQQYITSNLFVLSVRDGEMVLPLVASSSLQ